MNIEELKLELKKSIQELSCYNFETFTAIELYYTIANKLNEVIKELSRHENLVSEEIIKQNEILQEMLDSGLHNEVIEKINNMVLDGTMDLIINQNVLEELNSQIKEKVNFSEMKYKYLENDSLVCVTYDNENPRNYKLMVTFDGVTFNEIDKLNLKGWDYCIAYNNGFYYLCYDFMSDDFVSSNYPYFTGANKIGILKTKDFVSYDKIDIQLPSFFKQTWGPEIIFKDNNLHMFFSGCNLTDTSVDCDGVTQYIKNTYYTVSNDDGITWSNPVKINLYNENNVIDDGNKIDPSIIEKNGKYYLFLKNENLKYIEQYESNTIDGDYKLINILNDRYFVEAPSVCYFNGLYYLYCDMYATGKYIYYTSTDLKNWSKSNILSVADNTVMRHFTPCKVYDKQLLKDIVKRNGYDPLLDNYKLIKNRANYIVKLENKTYDTLSLKPNAIYTLSGVNDCIVERFDVTNLNKGDKCYFVVSSDVASLRLKNNTQGVYLQNEEVVLNKFNKSNNKLIEFVCVDLQPTFCLLNHSDLSEFHDNSKTLFSEELIDNTTSIKATFIKRNKIVQGNFVCQLTKNVDVGVYTLDFKAPFLPIADAYNTVFMGYNENSDLQFRSVKIFFDGRVEVRTTTPIKAGQYFECSVTYIEK